MRTNHFKHVSNRGCLRAKVAPRQRTVRIHAVDIDEGAERERLISACATVRECNVTNWMNWLPIPNNATYDLAAEFSLFCGYDIRRVG